MHQTTSTKTNYPNHRRRGVSYVEVIVVVVVVAVLLVPALHLLGNLGQSRRNTLDKDTAESLALDMIQEIKQQHYRDPTAPAGFGIESGEQQNRRVTFDDVDDYNDWTAGPPKSPDGQPYTQYPNLTRAVTVRYVAAADFTLTAAEDQGFKEVVITVTSNKAVLAQQTYVIPDAP